MKQKGRLTAIDATRGTAMLFVCISHMHYYLESSAPRLSNLLVWCGYIATPTFLLLSGLIASYQLTNAPGRATALRILDRGLFVLLVGHVLVVLSEVLAIKDWSELLHVWVITDTIGLLLCATWLCGRLTPRQLLVGGVLLLAFASCITRIWVPETSLARTIGLFLLGMKFEGSRKLGLETPMLAWLGLFLIGMYTGKVLTRHFAAGRTAVASRLLVSAGGVAIGVAAAAFLLEHTVRNTFLSHGLDPQIIEGLRQIFDPRQKIPPSPSYLLLYGGTGVLLAGTLMNGRLSVRLAAPVAAVAVIGRASFVAFVAQQWIIQFLPYFLGIDSLLTPTLAMLYLVAAMVAIFLIATAWDHAGGNRYLTLGLKPKRAVVTA